jgi:tetratricopeptide (TPR) repeat protein
VVQPPNKNSESADADSVNTAIAAISIGDFNTAEHLLLKVIANTPKYYSSITNEGGGLAIKFWDQTAFLHYVTWQKQRGIGAPITWVENAYPRAHFYLGFLCVKNKQYDRAIEYLDKGMNLEPENPKYIIEKAAAFLNSRRFEEALALYDQLKDVGPHISSLDLAIAQRGRGFVLIELGKLDDAEKAFLLSLKYEPNNTVALNELRYIRNIREGGPAAPADVIQSNRPSLSKCVVCGKLLTKGLAVSLDGRPVLLCKRCGSKLTKKWWQFWKMHDD